MSGAPEPKPGAFDWIVGGTKEHTIDIPLDPLTPGKTLRVEITAKARVSPSYPWGVIILTWGIAVLVLLALLVSKPAHAGDPNYSPAWGQQFIGQNGWGGEYHAYGRTPTYVPPMPPAPHSSTSSDNTLYRTTENLGDGTVRDCWKFMDNGHWVTGCERRTPK